MDFQEQYSPKAMAANSSYVTLAQAMGGFICTVSGTLNVTGADGVAKLTNLPVTAGVYHPIPLYLGPAGGTIALSGGAAGTVLI